MADQDKVDWDNHVKKNPHLKDKLKILSWSINVKWSDGEEEDLSFRLIAFLIADNKINEATIKLHSILKKDKKVIKKLFEIYPQAKEIQEIVDIIAQYKD